MEINLRHWNLIERWFNNYIATFGEVKNKTEYMFDLKRNHSYRVSDLMETLAEDSNFTPSEMLLSKIIGLLHDVGRFPQFIRYHTFNDRLSVDHGQLSINVLKEESTLDCFSDELQKIIFRSIYNHNKQKIAENLSPMEQKYSELIRDADKLDIYYLTCPIFEEEGNDIAQKLLLSWSSERKITPEVADFFLSGQTISHRLLKTVDDYKISLMTWVYDFNTPASRRLFLEKKYLQRINATLPPGPLKNKISIHVEKILAHS